jgi:cysteine-rich repeat protein
MLACSGGDDRPPTSGFNTGNRNAGGNAGNSANTGGSSRGGTSNGGTSNGGTSNGQAAQAGQLNAGGAAVNGGASNAAGSEGTTTGGSSTNGGTTAAGGSGAEAGSGVGGGVSSTCGNGVREGEEGCDKTDLDDKSCANFGYSAGSLSCTSGCALDPSGCSGVEQCADARDNDGDNKTDCEDGDCAAACTNSCTNVIPLVDPSSNIRGDTTGHAAQINSTCKAPDQASGSEVVYKLIPNVTGILNVGIETTSLLTLSVFTACGSEGNELDCSTSKSLNVPVTKGQAVYIAVDGFEALASGSYKISASTHSISCGDGHRDAAESCDDANQRANDGCSPTCEVESDETDGNDTIASASPYPATGDFYGEISTLGDVDFVSINVLGPASKLVAEVVDLGDGACGKEELDSYLELYGPAQNKLVENDDGPEGYCSKLTATGLAAGTYYLKMRAAAEAVPSTFPYALVVSVQ